MWMSKKELLQEAKNLGYKPEMLKKNNAVTCDSRAA